MVKKLNIIKVVEAIKLAAVIINNDIPAVSVSASNSHSLHLLQTVGPLSSFQVHQKLLYIVAALISPMMP